MRQPSGDLSAVAPPVPIPNTEVKRCSPDDSASLGCAKVGRRQIYAPPLGNKRRGFLFGVTGAGNVLRIAGKDLIQRSRHIDGGTGASTRCFFKTSRQGNPRCSDHQTTNNLFLNFLTVFEFFSLYLCCRKQPDLTVCDHFFSNFQSVRQEHFIL